MSYEAMHKVRASGLTDRTQVDVLEALAFFHNGKTGACFPSTEAIARISRVNDRTVRITLKALHELGLISSTQKVGQKRYFTLNLDRLPASEPLQEITGEQEITPLQEITGGDCKNLQETPVKTYREPLQKLTPEQGINKEEEGIGTRNSPPERTPWETDLLSTDVKKIDKPKKERAKPKTSCPFSPDDPIPPEYLEYAQTKHPSINPQTEFTKFVNFHISKDNKYSNWLAAWRTWTTKAEEFASNRPKNQTFPFGKPTDPQYGIGVCELPPEIAHKPFDPEAQAEFDRKFEIEKQKMIEEGLIF